MGRILHQIVGMPPQTAQELLAFIDPISFPNMMTAFGIFATIPVTTCTCERSISTLRRLKTYLRSTVSETRMTGLAKLNVHREIELDIDDVIERFARKGNRKLLLC